jgi:hypothetical protein
MTNEKAVGMSSVPEGLAIVVSEDRLLGKQRVIHFDRVIAYNRGPYIETTELKHTPRMVAVGYEKVSIRIR